MRSALITGACGFIGKNLVSELLSSGYRVFATDLPESSPFEKNARLTYISCDLMKETPFGIPVGECEVLYHLAWCGVSPEARENFDLQMKNFALSQNAVRLAKTLGIKTVIFVGSTMEYSFCEGEISEKSAPSPLNLYAAAKLSVRYLCESLARLSGIAFRYAVITSIYGRGREDGNLIYYCIRELFEKRSPRLSPCKQIWDFIHIEDAARALRLIGEKGRASFYAVGTGENRPLSDTVNLISGLIDKNIPVKFGAIPYGESGIINSAVNTQSLRRDTGFKPKYSLDDGIRQLIDYYKKEFRT